MVRIEPEPNTRYRSTCMAMYIREALLEDAKQDKLTITGWAFDPLSYVASHLNAAALREALNKPSRCGSNAYFVEERRV